MSVIASAADSALDLVSGAVLFVTQRAMARVDRYKYPEGKARLEPVGIVIFSTVMGMSSLQIIIESVKTLATILSSGPTLDLTGEAGAPQPHPPWRSIAIFKVPRTSASQVSMCRCACERDACWHAPQPHGLLSAKHVTTP